MAAPTIVVMGVAGSGKTTVGRAVASRLGLAFVDGDDLHSAQARAQMARGEPLTEEQRAPWLDRLHTLLADHAASGIVLACSALTIAARRRLAAGLAVRFVALVVSERALADRLAGREGHFAGADLLASQLATLELDDTIETVDGERPVDRVVDEVVATVL